jgi:UDP-2,3-diacylglucosamine hydrolase
MAARVVLVGDAHLGPANRDSAGRLHAFLRTIPGDGDHLVVMGDLFDFWFEYRSVIPREAFPTLTALSQARARGVRLTVIGGNHDRWGGDFWTREMGAEFHPRGADLILAGFRARLAHGDGDSADGLLVRLVRALAHQPITSAAVRLAPPDLAFWAIQSFSRRLAERTRSQAELDRAAARQAIRAREVLSREPELELLVLGHTHRAVLERLGERRWYLNPGAWADGGRYAMVTESGPALCRFE